MFEDTLAALKNMKPETPNYAKESQTASTSKGSSFPSSKSLELGVSPGGGDSTSSGISQFLSQIPGIMSNSMFTMPPAPNAASLSSTLPSFDFSSFFPPTTQATQAPQWYHDAAGQWTSDPTKAYTPPSGASTPSAPTQWYHDAAGQWTSDPLQAYTPSAPSAPTPDYSSLFTSSYYPASSYAPQVKAPSTPSAQAPMPSYQPSPSTSYQAPTPSYQTPTVNTGGWTPSGLPSGITQTLSGGYVNAFGNPWYPPAPAAPTPSAALALGGMAGTDVNPFMASPSTYQGLMYSQPSPLVDTNTPNPFMVDPYANSRMASFSPGSFASTSFSSPMGGMLSPSQALSQTQPGHLSPAQAISQTQPGRLSPAQAISQTQPGYLPWGQAVSPATYDVWGNPIFPGQTAYQVPGGQQAPGINPLPNMFKYTAGLGTPYRFNPQSSFTNYFTGA